MIRTNDTKHLINGNLVTITETEYNGIFRLTCQLNGKTIADRNAFCYAEMADFKDYIHGLLTRRTADA